MPSSSSLLSLARTLVKATSPSPLRPAAISSRCFSAKAPTVKSQASKGKGKAAAISPRAATKPPPATSAETKPKKIPPQPVYKVSPGLSSILQISETTRPDALKRLWIYIKAHNLQSASDKRLIVCDSTLKKAFGQDNLKFSEVLKCINPHLTRKV